MKLDLDILCLEKVFDGRAHKVLSKALTARYPYQYGPANSKFSIKVNSGVLSSDNALPAPDSPVRWVAKAMATRIR